MYIKENIMRRIRVLEHKYIMNLPIIIAKYEDGKVECFEGIPTDELFREENPIIKTWGSEFAEMLNIIINPVQNRKIEDFE